MEGWQPQVSLAFLRIVATFGVMDGLQVVDDDLVLGGFPDLFHHIPPNVVPFRVG